LKNQLPALHQQLSSTSPSLLPLLKLPGPMVVLHPPILMVATLTIHLAIWQTHPGVPKFKPLMQVR